MAAGLLGNVTTGHAAPIPARPPVGTGSSGKASAPSPAAPLPGKESGASGGKKHADTIGVGVHPPGKAPELAVVFDPTYRPAAKDLQLTLESERRAEADAHFMRGLLLDDTADSEKAQEEYLKALALDPSNTELSIKLAIGQLQRGDTPAAIGLLKDTIKAAPKRPQPYLALSYVYFKGLEKTDLAQKFATQALDVDPGNIFAYQYLTEIYAASNQSAKIGSLLERAAKVDSRQPDFWIQLAELYASYYLKGDAAKNQEHIKKTNGFAQKALSFGKLDVETLTRAAKIFVDTQQYNDAAATYRKIVEIDPNQNGARENLARSYLNSGERDKAIATLEDMIKRNPIQGHAYELLGGIYEDAKEYDKASASYQQSLLVSPNQPENYRSMAVLLLQRLKKPEKAVEVLTEARRRFPDVPLFSYLMAVSLSSAKKYQQALTVFEQALLEARNAGSDILKGGEFYFQYGNAAEQAGLYDKATELLRKSLDNEDNPRQIAETSNYLGYMWVEHNQHLEEAGGLIRKALEIDPDNGAFLDSLGWYYYRTGRYDKALGELKRAIEVIKPEDSVVYDHLGDTYLKLNDSANALLSWQKALELNPDEANRAAITKKIEDGKAAQVTENRVPGTR